MQYNKVEICGINTGRLKVLKEKEKMELLKKAQAGDKNARNELVEGNLRLVLSVVQRFSNRGENMDDLFQVGVIGLIKAIDNFNTDLDVRFSTYAVPMCIGEIRRYLRDDNPIRVSRSMRDTAYKAMQVKEQLINENGKEPTIEEIAQRLEMKKSDVVLALEAIVDAEKIKATAKDIDKEIENMANMYQMEVDKIKEMIGDAEKEQIGKDLAVQKAVDFVVKNAVEVEPAEEDKEEK